MSAADDYVDSVEPAAGQFDLAWVLGFLRRYCWWIVGVTALALVPAFLVPYSLDDEFVTSARVIVTAKPQAMEMGADYMPNQGPRGMQNPLSREGQVALSDSVLGRVVDQLPDPGPHRPGRLERLLSLLPFYADPRTLAPAQIRKARIDTVKRQIRLELGESGDLIEVFASAKTADSATFLANALADAIVEYTKDEQREGYERTVTWLNTQLLELRERIGTNQETRSQHMAKYGFVTEPSDSKEKGAREQLMARIQDTDIELQSVKGSLGELSSLLPATDSAGDYDPELLRVQQRYDAARTALEEARLTYTYTHPEVKRREAVVRSIEEELSAWGPRAPVVGPTGESRDAQREYRALKAKDAELRARRGVLQRKLDELTDPDADKTRAMGEFERLDRQLDLDREMLATLMKKRGEVVAVAAADFTRARVLDRAVPPVGPVGPDRLRVLLIGLVLAIGAGVGVALARELLDSRVRDPEEAKRLLGVPIIGMVPVVRDGSAPERQSEGLPSSLPAESYRNLRTALLFSSASQGFTTLVVTSGVAGEGKTTISANLASSFAQAGRSVLLIDADMRVPRVHRVFDVLPSPGLAELLRGETLLEAAVRRPSDGCFDVLTAGKQPGNPSELLASPEFAMLLARVRTQYDLVILDSPVLLGVSDTQLLTSQADATLVVQRPGSLAKRGLREVRMRLDQAGARILGVVFNQVPRGDRHFYPSYMESPYLPDSRKRQALEV